jgi:type IV secretory pathway VirB3-like protein
MQQKLHISIVIKQVSFVEILVTNTLITCIIIIVKVIIHIHVTSQSSVRRILSNFIISKKNIIHKIFYIYLSLYNPDKTTDLSQVTDKLYHTSPWSRFELTTSVAIGTDCIGNCKSNYHTITTTAGPLQEQWKGNRV